VGSFLQSASPAVLLVSGITLILLPLSLHIVYTQWDRAVLRYSLEAAPCALQNASAIPGARPWHASGTPSSLHFGTVLLDPGVLGAVTHKV